MATDWQGLLAIAIPPTMVFLVCLWVDIAADRRMADIRRRFGSPQAEPTGTGVERAADFLPSGSADDPRAPRSPQSPVVGEEDPRPATPTTGPGLPAGMAESPSPAMSAGLQRRRVFVHGC